MSGCSDDGDGGRIVSETALPRRVRNCPSPLGLVAGKRRLRSESIGLLEEAWDCDDGARRRKVGIIILSRITSYKNISVFGIAWECGLCTRSVLELPTPR